MLGWHVSVYRLPGGGRTQPEFGSEVAETIAVWQTGLHGLDWLDALVQARRAVLLGGNGYPAKYAALARYLLPELMSEPPSANPVGPRGYAHELGHALWGTARTLRAQFRLVKAAKYFAESRRVENSTRAGGRPPVSGPGGTFDGQAAGIQEIYWPADADNPFRRLDRGIWSDELAQAVTSSSLPFPAPPQ